MRQIYRNQYIKSFRFTTKGDLSTFIGNQEVKNILRLEELFEDNYYCYICYHSLTGEKQFVVSFSSDKSDDELSFLFWNENQSFVLETGKDLYLIDDDLNIKAFFDITTPLIGLYITSCNNLLVLEEASLRLINSAGHILESCLFDLIENFSIADNQLSIQTSEGNKIFELC